MTSFSPRKRRTTRPNTRLSTRHERRGVVALAVVFAVLLGSVLHGEDLRPAFALARKPRQADGTRPSPLDRLKSRNAKQTWDQLSKEHPRPAPAQQKTSPPKTRDELPADTRVLPGEDEGRPLPLEPEGVPARTLTHDPARGTPTFMTAQIDPIPQVSEPVRDPRELKKLSTILPYLDYEPDLTLEDRCQDLCPRPGHCPDCLRIRPEDLAPGQVACQECPEEVVLSRDMFPDRAFAGIGYAWAPSNVHYNPLYFEDVNLERYGHTRGFFVQPIVSVGKFTAQTLFMPYQLSLNPPWRCKYPLGYYRPGHCVPYMYYQVPLDAQAALVQATAVTGAYYLFAP